MIPIALAPEPATFDAKVRKKGEAVMLERIGKGPSRRAKTCSFIGPKSGRR